MLARHVGPSGTTRACPCEARAATRPALVARDQEPVADERAAASASAGPFVQANQFEADHQQHHRSSAEAAAALASASAALDYYRPGQSDLDGPPPSGPDLAAANRHHHHQRQQLNQALNIRPSSSSYSMSAANAASHQHLLSRLNAPGHLTFRPEAELGAHAGPPMRRDSLDQAANIYYRQSPPTTPNGSALAANGQDKSQEAFNLTSHKMDEADDFCQLRGQIQDMQILFQVNRLIIDRSILLLLSASKCCLRLGSERQKGFEARRLIGVQIRVSISVIMALVKCSVFDGHHLQQQQYNQHHQVTMAPQLANGPTNFGCCASGADGGPTADFEGAPATNEHRHRHRDNGPNAGAQLKAATGDTDLRSVSSFVKWADERQRLGLGGALAESMSHSSPLNESAELHQLMRAALDDGDQTRSHQRTVIHRNVGEPLAQLAAINNDNWQRGRQRQTSSHYLPAGVDESRVLRTLDLNQQADLAQRPLGPGQPARPNCTNSSLNSTLNNNNKPLDIMGHFLVTLGGTLSAHDSIQGLQILVESFTNVRNQDQLAAGLDHVLELTSNGVHLCRLWRPHCQTANNPLSQQQQQQQYPNNPGICTLDEEEEASRDQENRLAAGFEQGTCPLQKQGPACQPRQPLVILEPVDRRCRSSSATLGGGGGGDHLEDYGNKTRNNNNQNLNNRPSKFPPVALMNKRQLVAALNLVFLGELKQNLVERLHEFTDCAYTKHEHRETILSLLASIKFILNKFVKLIYRLRRRIASPSEPNQLSNLRQFARQLVDFCGQLSYELQTAAIELADELDRLNGELELTKQMKHLCLVGDTAKARLVFNQFSEHSEQLVEICRMLNQIAPTNKLKITTKSLANWFQLNHGQLVAFAGCLSENPISKTAKNCVWTYIQVWSSFYDDFGQLARQLAYLAHSRCDPSRASRVASLRDQIDATRGNYIVHLPLDEYRAATNSETSRRATQGEMDELGRVDRQANWPGSPLQSIGSLLSLGHNQQFAFELAGQPPNDSPRSLDHYHGFGPNYRRWHEAGPPPPPPVVAAAASAECPNSSAASVSMGPSPQSLPAPSKFFQDELVQQFGSCEPALEYPGGSRQQQVASCDSSLSSLAAAERQYLMGGTVTPSSQLGLSQLQHQLPLNPHHYNQQQQQPQPWTREGDSAEPTSSLMGTITPSFLPFAGSITPLAPTSIRVDPTAPPIEPPSVPARRSALGSTNTSGDLAQQQQQPLSSLGGPAVNSRRINEDRRRRPQRPGGQTDGSVASRRPPQRLGSSRAPVLGQPESDPAVREEDENEAVATVAEEDEEEVAAAEADARQTRLEPAADQNSIASSTLDGTQNTDKWSDSEADAIVRGARETAQMALSMYQFTRGEGDLNTTQDLFTQAELFAEEANELYKEVRCFSYKVPAGDLKKELLFQLSTIPALVQQLQFTVKNPTVGKAATFAKVDSVIRETKSLMEAVNRVVEATLSCRQHYNMASASLRKRTRTLSPAYRGDKFEFDSFGSPGGGRGLGGAFGGSGGAGRHASNASGGMGSEPDI